MIRLYLTPVPDRTANTAGAAVASRVQQSGLLDAGGSATENIAIESADYSKEGRIQDGATLSRKVAQELTSLANSSYTTLPLYDAGTNTASRDRGYYEVREVNVRPAQESRDDVYQYSLSLAASGTKENSRRAVRTTPQDVDVIFDPNVDSSDLAIPATATNVRWYTEANGTESATAIATEKSQYGDVDFYNTLKATGDDPTLTYDLPLPDDGPVDVRILDTKNRMKFAQTASGGQVNVWTHVFDPGYQFTGSAVIDTGRARLYLGGDLQAPYGTDGIRTVANGETFTVATGNTESDDSVTIESGGTVVVESGGTYQLTRGITTRSDFAVALLNANTREFENYTLDKTTDWELKSWSIDRIGPARVVVNTRWSDGSTEQLLKASCERGLRGVIWIIPENEPTKDPAQELKDLLEPISVKTSLLPFASQGLIDRTRLEE